MEYHDIDDAALMFGQNKNSGRTVKTHTGLIGHTCNHEDYINDKVIVHTLEGKLLCRPETLKITGFID